MNKSSLLPLASTPGESPRQALRTMNSHLLVMSGVSTHLDLSREWESWEGLAVVVEGPFYCRESVVNVIQQNISTRVLRSITFICKYLSQFSFLLFWIYLYLSCCRVILFILLYF